MKSKIYEFDPVIYPIRLWVSKRPSKEDVSEHFYPFNNSDEMVDDFGDVFSRTGCYANTLIVGKKKEHIKGCLVSIMLPGSVGAGVCAHEALHFAAYLSERFDIPLGDFDRSEPLAYFMQWATNCIWCTLIGHPEKMNGVLINDEDNTDTTKSVQ